MKIPGPDELVLFWMFGKHHNSYNMSRTLRRRHNGRDCVLNHQPHDCILNRLFGRRSKWTSKLRVTGLCVGNSPGTGEFPAQMASNAENVSIWWRHHEVNTKRKHHANPIWCRVIVDLKYNGEIWYILHEMDSTGKIKHVKYLVLCLCKCLYCPCP